MQTSSDFSQAFDSYLSSQPNLVQGENGANAHATAADSSEDFLGLLSEIFLLVRGQNIQSIIEKLNTIKTFIDKQSETVQNEYLIKLVKITLFLREPRKGKGERDLFYTIVQWLWTNYNSYARVIMYNLHDFGYWGDYTKLFELSTDEELKSLCVNIYATQLLKDKQNFDHPEKLSLAGKWAPREGSKHNKFAKALTKKMFRCSKIQQSKQLYRRTLACLNQALKTTESIMCENAWSTIDFKNVPSVAMTKLSKAFQDEKVSPFPKDSRKVTRNSSGRRHVITDINYTDREECRTNLIEHIKTKKVNSTVTDLSKIIQNYFTGSSEDIVWEAQWEARVNEIKELVKTTGVTPSIFPMIDLSSSMSGNPMIYAITLGLFTSMLIDNPVDQPENAFANRFMTFNTVPELARLPREGSLYTKLKSMKEWEHKWGGTTDIKAAIEMLLDIGVKNNLPQDKMPKVLAIFSDMQFNQGDSAWNETSFQMIRRKFEEKSYQVPHIIFWNLRSNTTGYQVPASFPNTTMLGGFSTRLMDLFLTGSLEDIQAEINSTPVTSEKVSPTTISLMEKVFSHEMFTKLEVQLVKHNEVEEVEEVQEVQEVQEVEHQEHPVDVDSVDGDFEKEPTVQPVIPDVNACNIA